TIYWSANKNFYEYYVRSLYMKSKSSLDVKNVLQSYLLGVCRFFANFSIQKHEQKNKKFTVRILYPL
ncbi:MAG: hypothetical protein V1859_07920, partial [archaeon]